AGRVQGGWPATLPARQRRSRTVQLARRAHPVGADRSALRHGEGPAGISSGTGVSRQRTTLAPLNLAFTIRSARSRMFYPRSLSIFPATCWRFLPHRIHAVNKTLLSCALGALLLTPALAAQADDDRFTLRLGGMHAKAESQFSADTVFGGEEYAFESERYELGEKTVPRVEGAF